MIEIKNFFKSFNIPLFLFIFYLLIVSMILKYVIQMYFEISDFFLDIVYIPLFIYFAFIIGILSGRQKQADKELQKRITERLQMENLSLVEANRLKSEFVAKMSHDLRTPLNAIIGYSEMLVDQTYGKLNKKQIGQVKNIYKSGGSLLTMIEDILNISKIEAGKLDFHIETLNAKKIIKEVQNENLPLIKAKHHNFNINVKPGIIVRADKLRLKQCLNNLVSNSIKFTPNKGLINVRATMNNDYTTISVKDTGRGIDPDNLDSIFHPFFQESDQKLTEGGTGLGLHITKNLVEMMGGEIWVESKVDRGSTFYLKLPAK